MPENTQKPSFWNIIVSVLAAMFGVQTEGNRKRDFNQKNPLPYLIVGIVILIFFVFSVYGLVSLVMRLNQ